MNTSIFNSIRTIACAGILTLALAFASAPAHAGLQGQIDTMFNTMSNATGPTASMGQRRGALAGGRYSLRSKIMDIQIITALPPSINAGCAGIDLFGGSFSFISADQFVQSLRAIAANAAGYAFKIAMETMCPTCASVMASLRKLMNTMNKLATDSCAAAKDLVNNATEMIPDTMRVGTDKEAAGWAVKLGKAVDDLAAGFPSIGSGGSSLSKVAESESGKEELEDHGVIGNIVWQELNKSGVGDWWTDGDVEFLEAIMSVSGSVIIHPPTDPEKDPEITPLEPILTVKDFMSGVSGSKVQVYKCDGGNTVGSADFNSCYQPEVLDSNVVSFKEKVDEMVRAVTDKYVDNAAFDSDELDFIKAAPASVGATLRNLGRLTPGMAKSYAHRSSGVIAQIMAADLVLSMMDSVRKAMAASDAPAAPGLQAKFSEVAQELRQEAMQAQGELEGLASLTSTYNNLMQGAKKDRMGLGQLINQASNGR